MLIAGSSIRTNLPLPLDKVEATLNFVLSLKNKPVKKRPLGLLKGKVEFAIDENFKMTDEEFLQS